MKKIMFLTLAILMSTYSYATDYSQYCASSDVKKDFLGGLSSVTGVNFVTRNIVEHEITKAIKDETGAKIDIQLSNFFGKNITSGEFKNIQGEGKDINFNGHYISNFNFSSLCDYNHIDYENNKLSFKENLVLNFDAKMTQDDLNKYLSTTEYQKTLDKLNQDKTISKLFKIEDGKIQIAKDKLQFNYKITPLPTNTIGLIKDFLKPITISYGANLRIKDNKVELCDFDLNSMKFAKDYLLPLINKTNPTVFNIKVDKDKNATLDIQNIKIEDSKILFSGVIFVPKD